MFAGMYKVFSDIRNWDNWGVEGTWIHTRLENKISSRFEVGCPCPLLISKLLPPFPFGSRTQLNLLCTSLSMQI